MIKTTYENDEKLKKLFENMLYTIIKWILVKEKKIVVILNHITIMDKMIKRHNGLFDNVRNNMTNLSSMLLHTTND